MKKSLLSAVLLLLAATLWAQRSQVRELKMTSAILGVEKELSVYLPAGYENSTRSYPVLYLLHGASDDHRAWLQKGNVKTIADEAIAGGASLPVIIVMPDASGEGEQRTGLNMGYFNMQGWAYEDYFFRELIPFIDKTFRTLADKRHRAVAGLSMGGGGTTVYAQRHPEVFGSGCPMSALITFSDRGNSTIRRNEQFVVSVDATDPLKFVRSATPAQIESMRSVRWLIDCGDDDHLLEGNLNIFMEMRRKNIPAELRVRNGAHNWNYWQVSLSSTLQFISVGFAGE